MDIDLSLYVDKLTVSTELSSTVKKLVYECWEKSNRLSLIFIKLYVSKSIRELILKCENVKNYIKAIEEQFISYDKAP